MHDKTTKPSDLVTALNVACVIVDVLFRRVSNASTISETQWVTLRSRHDEWMIALAAEPNDDDQIARVHLNKISRIVGGILMDHLADAYLGTAIWNELCLLGYEADQYLDTLPFRKRKLQRARRAGQTE